MEHHPQLNKYIFNYSILLLQLAILWIEIILGLSISFLYHATYKYF